MKTIRSFTRGQMALVGSALCLLAVLAIVPWQVVAQEATPAPDSAAQARGLPSLGLPAKGEKSASDKSASDNMLIGTWRGGPSGSDVLTIQKDGNYTWLFRTDEQGFTPPFSPRMGAPGVRDPMGPGARGAAFGGIPPAAVRATYTNNSGRWKLDGNTLVLIYQPMPLTLRGLVENIPGAGSAQPTDQWPTDFEPEGNVYSGRMAIVRVDDSLLRLMGQVPLVGGKSGEMQPTAPKFFKRVDTKSATPEFAADVPPAVQHLVQLASLNAQEAHLMIQWFDDVNKNLSVQHRKELHFEMLDRLQAARTEKIDFAELFQLTAEEAKEYRVLNKLAGGIGAIGTLAEQGQLTPVELSALKKITKFKSDIDLIGGMIEYELQLLRNSGGIPGTPTDFVPADAEAARRDDVGATPSYLGSPDNHVRAEMIYKLQTLFIELDSWLNSTVFN